MLTDQKKIGVEKFIQQMPTVPIWYNCCNLEGELLKGKDKL